MKLFEINWCPNEKHTIEFIMEYHQPKEVESMLHIDGYSQMNEDDRRNALCDLFRHNPAKLDEFWNLPAEVELPATFTPKDAEEYAWEWLENEYGTAVDGFKIQIDENTIIEKGIIAGVVYTKK